MNMTGTPENKEGRTGNGVDKEGGHTSMGGSSMSGHSGSTSTGSSTSSAGSTGLGSQSSTGSQGGLGGMLQSGASAKTEGTVARAIEQQTARLPSDLFLWAALGAMAASAAMEFSGNKDKSRFFGQWVAPLMLFGVYNKIVKTQGSDQLSS